ncbi:E3 ubiquitin-protein ligase HUWE1 isoform X2 [Drosophila santomea]|nr:E3 ubiquitin-protein ligase HUWE1 isoform X2 [Drosophila santomea]
MALLLPAALSHNHHVNESGDLRRNLRTRYRDAYKHNHDQEYCVEFEVLKSSKACHKLPPYNLMAEGDRITVRCDLEALILDSAGSSTTARTPQGPTTPSTTTVASAASAYGQRTDELEEEHQQRETSSDEETTNQDGEAEAEEEEEEPEQDEQDDLQNALDSDSNESTDYRHQRHSQMLQMSHSRRTAEKRSAVPATPTPTLAPTYHCRGEGLAGRTTRWSALPAPSCRGKWLRLTVGPPKKCGHAQFIFV